MRTKQLTAKLVFPVVTIFCTIFLNVIAAASPSAGSEQQAAYSHNRTIVRKVQIALQSRGYYASALDGYLGQATGDSIEWFQIDHSQKVIPLVDRALLVSLGIASD
jgi:peptidoglycan hydrolase-like protein with peptidoglycan-binding domain